MTSLSKTELCKKIKNDISNLNQNELEEIFKIIYKTNNNYSKNNNGVLINLSWLNDDIIQQINNYIDFCIKSHSEINKYENICNNFNKDINKTIEETNVTDNTEINNKNKQKVSSYMKFYLLKKKFMKQTFNHNSYKIDKPLTYEEYLLN
jgi:hypothetical protein